MFPIGSTRSSLRLHNGHVQVIIGRHGDVPLIASISPLICAEFSSIRLAHGYQLLLAAGRMIDTYKKTVVDQLSITGDGRLRAFTTPKEHSRS